VYHHVATRGRTTSNFEVGETCLIKHDVIIGGITAFKEGDWVSVEMVSPDGERPQYRYVVFSPYLGKMFQLSDNELAGTLTRASSRPGDAPGSADASPGEVNLPGLDSIVTPTVPGSTYVPIKPARMKSRYSRSRVLLVFGGAALLIIVAILLVMHLTKGPPDAAATTKNMFLLGEKNDWAGIQAMIDPDAHETDHDPTYNLKYHMIENPMGATYYSSKYGTKREVTTGLTGIYKLTQQVTGETAQVTVTTDASHILNSPVQRTGDVVIGTLWLVHKNGKWYITKSEIGGF